MNYEEFSDALSGLFAYDTGCVDSGIHDEQLRARVMAQLQAPETSDDMWLELFVRESYLSPGGLHIGYRLEDVREFIEWLRDHMDCDV